MILCLCPNPSIDKFVWFDTFEGGQVNRFTKEQHFPGGKGIHVALAARELGEEVIVLGFWGGATGRWLKSECEKYGIVCYGPDTEGWSRTCLTFKSEGKYDDTEILGCGPFISTADFRQFLNTFSQLITDASCVTMSGSWPEGSPSDSYAQLIEIATQAGKNTFLDCSGEQLSNALFKKPYLVHINEKEGQSLSLGSNSREIACLLSASCEFAAVTAGADGLYFATGNEIVHAQCEVSEVYSAVGSGDCLLAGLTVAFLRNMNLIDAAKFAVACGGANCIRQDLGMLYKSDVEILQKRAFVKNVNSEIR